jgi:hypothetical protein
LRNGDLLLDVCKVLQHALRAQTLTLTGAFKSAKGLSEKICISAFKRSRSIAQSVKSKHRALGAREVRKGVGRASRIWVASAEKVANPLKQAGLLIYAINHF